MKYMRQTKGGVPPKKHKTSLICCVKLQENRNMVKNVWKKWGRILLLFVFSYIVVNNLLLSECSILRKGFVRLITPEKLTHEIQGCTDWLDAPGQKTTGREWCSTCSGFSNFSALSSFETFLRNVYFYRLKVF